MDDARQVPNIFTLLSSTLLLGGEQVSLSVHELLAWNKSGANKEDNREEIEKERGLGSLEI